MNALTDKPKPLADRPRFSTAAGDRLSEADLPTTLDKARRRAAARGVRQRVTVYRPGPLFARHFERLTFVLQDER